MILCICHYLLRVSKKFFAELPFASAIFICMGCGIISPLPDLKGFYQNERNLRSISFLAFISNLSTFFFFFFFFLFSFLVEHDYLASE